MLRQWQGHIATLFLHHCHACTSAANKAELGKRDCFQRASPLIISLKQLFSSHSVPTSHSQLLAACTHMYVRPRRHFICGGNIRSVCLLFLNVFFFLTADFNIMYSKVLQYTCIYRYIYMYIFPFLERQLNYRF